MSTLRAFKGDRLVVRGHRYDEPDRDAEVLEVHGTDGRPPYLVRWADTGHVALFFPPAEAIVQHFAKEGDTGHAAVMTKVRESA